MSFDFFFFFFFFFLGGGGGGGGGVPMGWSNQAWDNQKGVGGGGVTYIQVCYPPASTSTLKFHKTYKT